MAILVVGVLIAGALVALVVVSFFALIRPWYLTWGAKREAAARALPGDELVPQPKLSSTRSIVIKAPVDQVWPWLLQLGYGRAGWYNHDWINCGLLGARYFEGKHSSRRILPQFQDLKVGDIVPLAADAGWEVVALERNRLMVLSSRVDLRTGQYRSGPETLERPYLNSGQVFLLEPLDDQTTRFTVRDRLDFDAGWLNLPFYLLEPGYFIQESAFMRGVKERAEANLRS